MTRARVNRRRCVIALVAASSLLLSGCDKKKAPVERESKTAETSKAADVGKTEAKGKAEAKKRFAVPGRSAVPSLAEWNAVTKEVTVKGSGALNCETKMVREWLRVSCRGTNDSGGKPTRVRVVFGGGPGTLSFASGGVTSLVTRFVEGLKLRADFSWTDKSHPLTLSWPRGTAMPVVLGAFKGAQSPLDRLEQGVSDKARDYACRCFAKNISPPGTPPPTKEECRETTVNEDCYHTFSSEDDCINYGKCALGEASHMPRCRPGYVQVFINRCAKSCDSGEDCPKGDPCAANAETGAKHCARFD